MLTTFAFTSVNLPLGVWISTSGRTDFLSIADQINDSRTPMGRMTFKDLPFRKRCAGVTTDPSRLQRRGVMVSWMFTDTR